MTLPSVVFSPEADADLRNIYDYIADRSSPERAFAYTERIRVTCLRLDLFPERGTPRNDIRPGLRTTSFERRATIAYHITPMEVVIDRILYAGRDLQTQINP